jgi:2-oxoglutarate dehydrogenase E1 component
VAQGVLSETEAADMVENYRQGLDAGKQQARASLGMIGNKYTVDWSKYGANDWTERVRGGGDLARLKALGERAVRFPERIALHPRVAQVMANRAKMFRGELPLDWGAAETLAYASILEEGNSIRLTGQDSGRGTFFHRHAVLHDQATGECYVPLQHLAERQPAFQVTDSVLSEEAVLGFEYGYSTTDPSALVIWEAQFGDFVNGAQVIIDQFISSGEAKWGRLCGSRMCLPHGYEGQGPEHSSAASNASCNCAPRTTWRCACRRRLRRCIHMLRRQILRSLRKPLIVMTPKSLLRHEQSCPRSRIWPTVSSPRSSTRSTPGREARQCAARGDVFRQGVLRAAQGTSHDQQQ